MFWVVANIVFLTFNSIPPEQQRLIFGGKPVHDADVLVDKGIVDKVVVHLGESRRIDIMDLPSR